MKKIEDEHCVAFANWLEFQKLTFSHLSNENGLSWANRGQAMGLAAKQRKMGKRRGVPDYVILTPKGTLWVEMKAPNKKLKKGDVMEGWTTQKKRGGLDREQYDWIIAINETPGAQAEVCYGAEEAIAFVTRILK